MPRIFSGLMLITAFQVLSVSCNPTSNNSSGDKKTDSITQLEAASDTNSSVPQPDVETAETIVAGYFSNLNRKAGFQQFKGLGIKISGISPQIDSTRYLIQATVSGRKRNSAGIDTSSVFYEEKLNLNTFYLNNSWQIDTTAY